jgi:pheromone shutdown protein TraB
MVAAVDLPPPADSPPNTPATRVLILGVSSASRLSADRARQLIRLARPDAVVLSLCRERAGLLIDPDAGDATVNAAQATAKWHCRRARFEGLPVPDEAAAKAAVDAISARLPADYSGPPPPQPPIVPHFPSPEALLTLVRTKAGVPVGVSDIEDDVRTLLATGLFARARPFCESGGPADAPLFAAVERKSDDGGDNDANVALRFVPPLASTRFIVSPRTLPAIKSMSVRVDSSAQQRAAELHVEQPSLDAAGSRAAKACRRGTDDRASLGAYTTARAELLSMFGCGDAPGDSKDYVVTFSGVESGRPEALIRRRRPAPLDPPFVSGLEASASGGEGLNIEAFKPVRQGLKLSRRMTLPPAVAQRVIAEAVEVSGGGGAGEAAAAAEAATAAAAAPPAPVEKDWSPATAPPRGSPIPNWSPNVPFREWTQAQADDAAAPAGVAQAAEVLVATGPDNRTPTTGAAATLAGLLSASFGALTSRAAATTGVARGAAWRAALDAATETGVRAVVLADRPQSATQRRLAETVAAGEGGGLARLAIGATSLVGGIVAAATHAASGLAVADASGPAADAAALAVGVAAAVAAVAPLAAPLADAWRFSRLASAEDVERDVALPAGVPSIDADLDAKLALGGEDAILRAPGAWRPLVDERDAFLAAVTAATAAGAASGAPAYVADLVEPVSESLVSPSAGDEYSEDDDDSRQQKRKQLVWRFMAGGRKGGKALDEGGAAAAAGRASLPGRGDGEFSWEEASKAQAPKCVVAVVGASHVRGMVRRWDWAAELARGEGEGASSGGVSSVEAALAPLILGADDEAEAVARAGERRK